LEETYGLAETPKYDLSVDEAVGDLFVVEDRYFDRDTLVFIVSPREPGDKEQLVKSSFKELATRLRPHGYLPQLRWITGRYYVSILRRGPERKRNTTRNKILFAATVCTVFLDGYLRSDNPVLTQALMAGVPVFVNALLFTVGIVAVFGLHEMGHKLISTRRGVPASMPYFIPAPPGMGGTFGAVITQDEPPVNRDDLFDLGISGPVLGFVATLIIALIGLRLSYVLPIDEVAGFMLRFPEIRFQAMPMPLLLRYISMFIQPVAEGSALILHPVAFAAWVGCLVTFINLIPAWQLDGGHVVRAIFGRETHKIVSAGGIIMLIVSGYFIMAVMVAFFMMRGGGEGMEPLDDVSPVSASRKLAMVGYLALMGVTLIVLTPF
jgi:Zn-dependent protease